MYYYVSVFKTNLIFILIYMINTKNWNDIQSNQENDTNINNIDINTSQINSEVNLILSDQQYKKIIWEALEGCILDAWELSHQRYEKIEKQLIENNIPKDFELQSLIPENDTIETYDNSGILSAIINRYWKKWIDTIFELWELSYFSTSYYYYAYIWEYIEYWKRLNNTEDPEVKQGILQEMENIWSCQYEELSTSKMIINIHRYVPSLELRQYLCEKILIEIWDNKYYWEVKGYLICCENSNLFINHEKILVKYLSDIDGWLDTEIMDIPNIINNCDLNILIQEIHQENLEESLDAIFEDYDIDQEKLNSESLEILKENWIL